MALTKVANRMLRGAAVSPNDFGAVGDGVTDDTVAVQAAIDYCLSFTSPLVTGSSSIPDLHITDKYFISSSLLINRPINQTGFWTIFGEAGNNGGFVTTNLSYIFDGDNGNYGTNQVVFKDLNFNDDNATASSSINAFNLNKFARCYITGCHFGMRIGVSSGYIQSIYISNCIVKGCTGSAIEAITDLYDVSVTNCMFEKVEGYIVSALGNVSALRVTDNLIQNNTAGIRIDGSASGVTISDNYVEANNKKFVGIGTANGVSINNNFIQTRVGPPNGNTSGTTFYEIEIGESNALIVQGNRATHTLVKITGTNNHAHINNNSTTGDEQLGIVKDERFVLPIYKSGAGGGKGTGRTYAFSKGYSLPISQINIDLGGAGNANSAVIIEIMVSGYNVKQVDYVITKNSTNTAIYQDRGASSAIPVITSGTGEQIKINIPIIITRPMVSVRVASGGYLYDDTQAINPTISFVV
jgi:parallel beta-helix repeat protein